MMNDALRGTKTVVSEGEKEGDMHNESISDERSTVRGVVAAVAGLTLLMKGQRLGAAILAAAFATINLLVQVRRSETGTPSSAQPGDLVVERRPPRGGPEERVLGQLSTVPADQTNRRRESAAQKPEKKKGGPLGFYHAYMQRHPRLQGFVEKLGKDNIGMLAAFVSWSILTSVAPIIAGLVFISSLFLRTPADQQLVINHLSAATQGAFSKGLVTQIVHASVSHRGLLGIIGLVGLFWGGSNVGGSFSTAFQAIFEVSGRNFIKEKAIDIGMLFVFTALMLVIIAAAAVGAILSTILGHLPVPGVTWGVGVLVNIVASFLLFASIYLVFPNIKSRLRLPNVWKGALLSAILFTILSEAWGIYAGLQHFNKYGQVMATVLILTAWIYFFSLILMIGAEVVAVDAIEEAKHHHESVGPPTQDSVPQHEVLRSQPAK